jgi:hypothetical protein
MNRKTTHSGLAIALAMALSVGGIGMLTQASAAVVYCKTVGVPKGCIVRPRAHVVAPVVRVHPAVRRY